jgi:hypothetical protein
MIGMVVGEKESIEASDRHAELMKPDRRAAAASIRSF